MLLSFSLVPRCLTWKEYVGHLLLAVLMFGAASLIFIKEREGKLHWRGVESRENNRLLSLAVAGYVGFMGTVTFLSTLFGWGC